LHTPAVSGQGPGFAQTLSSISDTRAEMPRCAIARSTIRVFIAEEHRITLWGLKHLIESVHPRMEVAGTATSRNELVSHPSLPDADLVLMDLDLNGQDVTEVMADVLRRCPGHVLILTGEDNPERHRQAVLCGARGLLHKSQSAETVLQAIEKVHAGEVWLERGLVGDVLGRLTGRIQAPPVQSDEQRRIRSLTPREREIVSLMTRSASLKQMAVADELGMSEHTLRNHLTTIYSKLKVRGRLELHVFATRHGLASADAPGVSAGPQSGHSQRA
jgi:two-component system nitrate/nitrite response regulator NarL